MLLSFPPCTSTAGLLGSRHFVHRLHPRVLCMLQHGRQRTSVRLTGKPMKKKKNKKKPSSLFFFFLLQKSYSSLVQLKNCVWPKMES